MIMNNKKTIIILILVLTIGIVGLTVAYFSNSTSIDNTFRSKEYGTTTDEDFVSPDNWLPGTTTPKTLTVTNSGNVDEAVRISYTETWTSKNAKDNDQEGDLPLKQNNNDVAIINLANTDDWSTVTENGVTYKYYKYKLAPTETTTSLLNSVTFNSAAVNNSNCVESTPEPGKKVITCDSTGNGYDGATYKLRFNVETVQYNQYRNAWGTSVVLLDEKPLVVYGLNVNRKSKTYETGDKHQMFEFEHSATEQTPALTDYRYIGNDPYNYVKFNCDNDGTNCEIWRIIGVFNVDDGNGNWEQRMKLVRGSDLTTNMKWNENRKNDWTANNSTLKTFLNGDYYNRTGDAQDYGLKSSSRSMTGDVVYYLGASNLYGTGEELYTWERGNTVCGECNSDTTKLTWTGKVGLMYPSDEYMVYGNGVNETCYIDTHYCSSYRNAQIGWVYKSNILEGQSTPVYTWLLASYSEYEYAFFASSDGYLGSAGVDITYGIRPVLYLKSSIQILSGDGSEQNPYVLSEN